MPVINVTIHYKKFTVATARLLSHFRRAELNPSNNVDLLKQRDILTLFTTTSIYLYFAAMCKILRFLVLS